MKRPAIFLALLLVTFSSFAYEVRTTCFKQSNYDDELILTHENGALKTLSFGNSDWNYEGPGLAVTEVAKTDGRTTYLVSEVEASVEIEDKVLKGEEGLAVMKNEKYDCGR